MLLLVWQEFLINKMEEYRLKLKDFIPINGLVNHRERCEEGMIKRKSMSRDDKEDYAHRCEERDLLLVIYNSSVIMGTVCTALGLAGLLNK